MDSPPNFFKSLVKVSGKVLFVFGLLLNICMIFFGFFPSLIYVLIMLSGAGMAAISKDIETPEFVSTDTNWLQKGINTATLSFQKTNIQSAKHVIKNIFYAVLIVVVSLGVIIVMGKDYFNRRDTINNCNEIKAALDHYKESKKTYPASLSDLAVDNPMLTNISKDKWDNSYQYKTSNDGSSFVLISAGKDGKFKTEDDLVFNN